MYQKIFKQLYLNENYTNQVKNWKMSEILQKKQKIIKSRKIHKREKIEKEIEKSKNIT